MKKVSDIVAEIAAASREQSSGIEQVNRAVMQMDELTQQNAALVEQATAASQAMADQARELNEMMARYRARGDRRQRGVCARLRTPAASAAERRRSRLPIVGAGAPQGHSSVVQQNRQGSPQPPPDLKRLLLPPARAPPTRRLPATAASGRNSDRVGRTRTKATCIP